MPKSGGGADYVLLGIIAFAILALLVIIPGALVVASALGMLGLGLWRLAHAFRSQIPVVKLKRQLIRLTHPIKRFRRSNTPEGRVESLIEGLRVTLKELREEQEVWTDPTLPNYLSMQAELGREVEETIDSIDRLEGVRQRYAHNRRTQAIDVLSDKPVVNKANRLQIQAQEAESLAKRTFERLELEEIQRQEALAHAHTELEEPIAPPRPQGETPEETIQIKPSDS